MKMLYPFCKCFSPQSSSFNFLRVHPAKQFIDFYGLPETFEFEKTNRSNTPIR